MPRSQGVPSPRSPKGPTRFGLLMIALSLLLAIGLSLLVLGLLFGGPPKRQRNIPLYQAEPSLLLAQPLHSL
ncbi:MAG: hypothetical protein GXY67_07380 [Clostridiales bacterium]|nr:hypothetical protein [Clostridiales bacterium]